MNQKTSILFLCRLYHPHIGGVEKHVYELSKELLKKNYSVTILTEKFDKKLKEHELQGGISIIRIPVGKNAFFKKFQVWKWMIINLFLIRNADMIHVHDVFYWLMPFRFFFPNKKIFVTFHGYEGYPIKKSWILHRKIIERMTNGSICVGDFMKKWYGTHPTAVIYGGVRLPKKISLPNPKSAVFFGRFDDQTGILEYVKAYEKIKKVHPDFKMTVVGEGKLGKKLPKSIKIIPFTKNIELYIQKNRFIFVSRYLSMLESLASKREVIAIYDNPVKRDYLLMSPFKKYVSVAKNEEEITQIVLKNLESRKSSNKLGSFEWVKNQSWEKIAEIYENLWNK